MDEHGEARTGINADKARLHEALEVAMASYGETKALCRALGNWGDRVFDGLTKRGFV